MKNLKNMNINCKNNELYVFKNINYIILFDKSIWTHKIALFDLSDPILETFSKLYLFNLRSNF